MYGDMVIVVIRTLCKKFSNRAIAKELGCSRGFVNAVAVGTRRTREESGRRMKVGGRKRRWKTRSLGTRHPKRDEAVKMRREGKSVREIAEFAGVSSQTVRNWVKEDEVKRIS